MYALTTEKPIRIEKYFSTFGYETMEFYSSEFVEFFDGDFFKDDAACKNIKQNKECIKLNDLKDDLFDINQFNSDPKQLIDKDKIKKRKDSSPWDPIKSKFNIGEYILQELILKKLFSNSLFNLINNTTNRNTLFILPYSNKPFINFMKKNKKLSAFYDILRNEIPDKIKQNLSNGNNKIVFIDIFPENSTDTVDIYSDKIKAEIDKIKGIIIEKQKLTRDRNTVIDNPYTKIIWLVNEDNTFFTNYFITPLGKIYEGVLNKYIDDLYSLNKIEKQVITEKPKQIFEPLKILSTINIISQEFKSINKNNTKKIEGTTIPIKDININNYKNNIIELLNKLELIYSIRLDISKLKSLTSLDNSSLFNIYIRFDNLDFPLITDELIPNGNILYILHSKNFVDRVGYFVLVNKNRNQYRFVLDTLEYSKFKDSYTFPESKRLSDTSTDKINKDDPRANWLHYVRYFKNKLSDNDKTDLNSELISNSSFEGQINQTINQEETVVNPGLIPTKSFLIEIRYIYGKIQYRESNTRGWKSENTIQYYKSLNSYENYTFFNHRMIDTSFKDNINIKYYKNILYNRNNLIEFLKLQQKYNDKTRLSYEFLNINNNIDLFNNYNSYIIENFKNNVDDSNVINEKFEDDIRKNICDIIFENSGLIYVKKSNRITEGPKETISSDNFKISSYVYNKINNTTKEDKIKSINTYFKKNKKEIDHLICNNKSCTIKDDILNLPLDLNNQIKKDKNTLALTIITITKELEKSITGVWFASQCKSQKRRLQQKWYDIIRMTKGMNYKGGYTKKRIKSRRTYSLKYRKV